MPARTLLTALGWETAELPDLPWPEARGVVVAYDSATRACVVGAGTEHVSVLAAAVGEGAGRAKVLQVRGRVDARMSHLPLVGDAVPADRDVVVAGAQFGHAASAWTPAQVAAVAAALDLVGDAAQVLRLPGLPAEGLAAGLTVGVELVVAGKPTPLWLAAGAGNRRAGGAA
ncbi:hypothetical protein [Streptoalloteichus hindustanus]|uniref:Uncharacterized protein n=1 Tax=Streptoalloteichus hindustanus TaxID=2017 RepID=A0A1M5M8C3_STRHI|nr:hypothetical protein [Streptoalloteichus hindustanus]SHG73063.1 hypothetical protein SAMN05444320_11314 [Streptoalloteichus hindustanus]